MRKAGRCPVLMLAIALPAGAVAAGGAAAQESPGASRFAFVDVHEAAGVTAITWCGRPEKPHILESGGTGLALFDYDGDDDLDLYLVSGWRLEGAEVRERGVNRLYRNDGTGQFEDVTDAAGVGDDGWGTGVAVGDVDGDGDQDLFVANFGPDVLYLNQGDGTFLRAPEPPSIDGWSATGTFFDADQDGDLDLFVAAYLESTLEEVLHASPRLVWRGTQVMMGPFGLEGLANRFFVNDGSGHFTEATEAAGLTDVGLFFSFGVAALDLDGDRLLDLYVANDSNPNYVYRNEGGGRFAEVGLWSGAAFDARGMAQAGMGLAAGDVDDDGLPELFVTNFENDQSTFYANRGGMLFEDTTEAAGLYDVTFPVLSWGTVLADFDLDGDLDLFIANGHIYPQADQVGAGGLGFRQPNQLLERRGGRFHDASSTSGSGLLVAESSRGVATGDLDGDGDLDMVVSNVDASPTVLRNDTPHRGRWLLVEAPGALEVAVQAGERRILRPFVAGASYASHSDPRFHFGLGEVEGPVQVTVSWPDGTETVVAKVAVDAIVRVSRPAR